MLFITVAFLIIAIISYILYMVASTVPLYHAVNVVPKPNISTYHIISNLPNKTLSNTSTTNAIQSIVSFYKDSYEQAFINACENTRWLSIKNNCSNPNDFNQAWSFLPSLTGSTNTITGSNILFSCNTKSAFGEYVLYSSISGLQSNTCVQCYYNLSSNTSIPYSMPLPYKINSPYGTNTTHSLTSMGDPCAVGSFISCTYVCG
ncbi:MAG: hypothetical protein ACP5S8_01175 [Hydrogenobaculum sp.]